MPLPLLSPTPSKPSGFELPPPPPGFRPVEDLQSAWRAKPEALPRPRAEGDTPTVAQLNGLRYERKVRERFATEIPGGEAGPWFFFRDRHGTRRCQPDLLFELIDRAIIAEVKLFHTTDAWWQLRKLYEPVVGKALGLPVRLLVITETYDPAIAWPEPLELLADPAAVSAWIRERGVGMGVLRWTL